MLDTGDKICDVLMPEDKLLAEVLMYNTKPASEKYKDSCRDMGVPCFKNISEKLTSMSSSNSLSLRLSLKRQHAEPLWSALRGNSALRNLELSYCKLDDNVLAMLCQVLPSLPHLSSLDISYNNLTSSSLTSLSRLCCPSLTKLSMSGNLLDDYCLQLISNLLSSTPTLTSFSLARSNLTKNLFQNDRAEFSSILKKSKLRNLDLSHNNFSSYGLEIILSALPSCLHDLNISGCNTISLLSQEQMGGGMMTYCSQGNPDIDLVSLSMSNLTMNDNVLGRMVSCLQYCGRLSEIRLDHNMITVSGLVTLLDSVLSQHVPLTKLTCAQTQAQALQFWEDKFKVDDVAERLEQLLKSNCSRLELLVLPFDQEAVRCISKVWDVHYKSRSKHSRDGFENILFSVQ